MNTIHKTSTAFDLVAFILSKVKVNWYDLRCFRKLYIIKSRFRSKELGSIPFKTIIGRPISSRIRVPVLFQLLVILSSSREILSGIPNKSTPSSKSLIKFLPSRDSIEGMINLSAPALPINSSSP